MKVNKTDFKGLLIIEPDVYGDNRGWFSETYSRMNFQNHGISVDFIQDNHSFSAKKGTLRGIHFQKNPVSQTKLVRCTRGSIIDTVVDLRKGSDTYSKWFSIRLSEHNKRQLLVPKGFGHAFLTETENTEVQYKVDEYYSREHDRSISYRDPEFNVEWGVDNPVISDKDANAPLFRDSDANFSVNVMVTGAKGQLGFDVIKRLNELGITNNGVDIDDFDITNKEETEGFILSHKPDVIIHCAAYTSVDKAEEEKEKCYSINITGTRNIAEACSKIDSKLIYISTDYVFDGNGSKPYSENDETNPLNYYGYTKEQGENIVRNTVENHYILRTSWAYGVNGNNFVKTMLGLARSKESIRVVNDQVGSPTYTVDLAELICDMFQTKKYGTYHATNEGYISWYEFACEIFRQAETNVEAIPIRTADYQTKAARPLNSRLSKNNLESAGFKRLPDWKDALERFSKEYNR